MVFSRGIFLFRFLPIFFVVYYVLPSTRLRNLWTLTASLYFYAYGEPLFVWLMVLSIGCNYLLGLGIYRRREHRRFTKRLWLLGVGFNFFLLFVFKYLGFFADIFSALSGIRLSVPEIPLPIGISFFTFQAYSYVYDVYVQENKEAYVQKDPLNLGLYISMFPQLIAGPIVRYRDVMMQIRHRRLSISEIAGGIERFVTGLSKKLLIADTMGSVAADVFATQPQEAGALWLLVGALSYSFQIYYDFSGYSDMAIGLGHMMGFSFRENFDYPYKSVSVTEFWRRWHISLSAWFRDYLYIPLGGSKGGAFRTVRNLFLVWVFTGLWHGANGTFVLWGLWYFVFLTGEKWFRWRWGKKVEEVLPKGLTYLGTMAVVLIGWILFNSPSIASAGAYLRGLFDWSNWEGSVSGRAMFYIRNFRWEYVAAVFFATDVPKRYFGKLRERYGDTLWFALLKTAAGALLFYICILYVMKGSYSPFIYFNF